MHVTQLYTRSPLRNFSYIIRHGSAAFAIDPFDGDELAACLRGEGLALTAIINTHHHGDHTCGNAALAAATAAPIWCHKDAKIAGASRALAHGQRLTLGDESGGGDEASYVEVLDTPGHTMSHICLLVVAGGKATAVLTGDTLFNGGVGNCRNGGDPDALFESVRDVILPLPDDVIVYPGHDYLDNNLRFGLSIDSELDEARQLLAQYPESDSRFIVSDLAQEKRISLFLQTAQPRLQELVAADAGREDASRAAFVELRRRRDRW